MDRHFVSFLYLDMIFSFFVEADALCSFHRCITSIYDMMWFVAGTERSLGSKIWRFWCSALLHRTILKSLPPKRHFPRSKTACSGILFAHAWVRTGSSNIHPWLLTLCLHRNGMGTGVCQGLPCVQQVPLWQQLVLTYLCTTWWTCFRGICW